MTGTTLAVARMAGETAPILFTSTLFLNATSSDPTHAARDRPVQDLRLLAAAEPGPARPGVGGGLRPDRVRARDQPERALLPVPQPAQARPVGSRPPSMLSRVLARARRLSRVHKPFTTPSPAFSPHAARAGTTLAANPPVKGREGDHTHMKRMLTTLAAVLAVGAVAAVGAGAKSHADRLTGRRQLVRLAARLALGGRLRVEDRHADRLQPGRLGRGHRRDHGAPGRLRRLRRAADARPVQRVQRAASRSRGRSRRRRSSTTCRTSRTTCT